MPARLAPGDPAFPGLSEAQFGTVAEERMASAITAQAGGIATVAFPLLDLGFDLYLRRLRTLRVHPVQVKARSFLDGDGQFQVGVASLHLDPNGYVVLPFVPPPDWQLATAFWAIPIPDFVQLARPHEGGYVFSGYLDGRLDSPANSYLVPVDRILTRWLHRIPGWTAPVHRTESGLVAPSQEVSKAAARAFGKFGELWLASQLMRVGLENVVLAQDRLRVDCVDLLLHDLRSFATRGLAVHIGTVNARRVIEFRIRADTFFVDQRLDVVCIPCQADGDLAETSLVIPSADIKEPIATPSSDKGVGGYQISFRLDPLATKMRPYAVPTDQLARAIMTRLQATS
ncbi:MAG TPA: hypothetical protein VIT43_09620 [Candidatus Dormibacteraeota bacterium]